MGYEKPALNLHQIHKKVKKIKAFRRYRQTALKIAVVLMNPGVFLCLDDFNALFIAGKAAEQHFPLNFSKKRMVGPDTDIFARVHFRPALTNDYAAGGNTLPAETFDSQHLRIRVTTVGTAAATFFMRHSIVAPYLQALMDTI
jgi:hypothetical protein